MKLMQAIRVVEKVNKSMPEGLKIRQKQRERDGRAISSTWIALSMSSALQSSDSLSLWTSWKTSVLYWQLICHGRPVTPSGHHRTTYYRSEPFKLLSQRSSAINATMLQKVSFGPFFIPWTLTEEMQQTPSLPARTSLNHLEVISFAFAYVCSSRTNPRSGLNSTLNYI